MGGRYAGFQVQKNANTIQAELEKALQIYFKVPIALTGSSRTDAGVHALQNFFHGDSVDNIDQAVKYNLNAILPLDIVVKNIFPVIENAHCRFDALEREYHYFIHFTKDPFMMDRGYFYPFPLNFQKLEIAAGIIHRENCFAAFAKKNTQVKSQLCTITHSGWIQRPHSLVYQVRGNRFLRGMVRALVGTMLKVGREKISVDDFELAFTNNKNSIVDFAAPAKGLHLNSVTYPVRIFL